jgi:type II secretory pathway pseudopilin PulG
MKTRRSLTNAGGGIRDNRGGIGIEIALALAMTALLVIVAIPGYERSQTRSRVSQCRSDLRALGVAVEAYGAEGQGYPTFHFAYYTYRESEVTEFFLGGSVLLWGGSPPFSGWNPLTTPVAYIPALPPDPFHSPERDDPPEAVSYMYVNWPYFARSIGDPARIALYRRWWGDWRFTSGGPDGSRAHLPDDFIIMSYDPTNGTLSLGQIHRSQASPEGIQRL